MTVQVEVRGNLEQAIKALRKKLQVDGIHKQLKAKRFYEKPSDRRKRKQREAERRRRKVRRRRF